MAQQPRNTTTKCPACRGTGRGVLSGPCSECKGRGTGGEMFGMVRRPDLRSPRRRERSSTRHQRPMERADAETESEDIMHPAAAIKLAEMTTGTQASFADIRDDRARRERQHPKIELPAENTD